MIPNASTQLSVAMVANNIGHAEDSNRSGKFLGSFTQSSTEPQIQPNLFERMNNCNELSPRIFAAQNEFSLEISSRINAIKEYVAESSSRSKQYMPRKFAEMSSKFRFGQEFVEKLGISSTGVCITFAQYCRQVIYRGESPVYITCLLICYSDLHSCNTRYANYNLVCPKFKHKLDGSKTFTVTTCQLWNCFPITL